MTVRCADAERKRENSASRRIKCKDSAARPGILRFSHVNVSASAGASLDVLSCYSSAERLLRKGNNGSGRLEGGGRLNAKHRDAKSYYSYRHEESTYVFIK